MSVLGVIVKIKPCILVLAITGVLSACAANPPVTSVAMKAMPEKAMLSKTVFGFTKTTSFDVYLDNKRIHLLAAGTVGSSNEQRVRYIHSDDGGQRWSLPIDIPGKLAVIASRGNDVQVAAKGKKLVALWQTAGELPNMGPMASAYSQDGGKTWQVGTNPAIKVDVDQSHIDITADQSGNFHAVWLDDRDENGYQGLRYARSDDTGLHWQNNQTLDGSTCSCCWNTLAIAPSGALNVLYRDMEIRDMALLQSIDKGNTWQHAGRVGEFGWKFDGCPHIGGSLAFSHKQKQIVSHSLVWTGKEDQQGLYYLQSSDNAKNWSEPYKLGQRALHGDIAVGEGDHLRVVWDEMSAEGGRIFSATSNDGGLSWSSAQQWSLAGHNASHPRILPTWAGFLLFWTETQDNQPTQLIAIAAE